MIFDMDLPLLCSSISVILITAIAVRIFYVFFQTGKPLRPSLRQLSYRTLVVLGSGGHTAEMLNLLAVLQKDRFVPRFYIAAATDNMSLQKARAMEESLIRQVSPGKMVEAAQFMQVYRSREVGQSYLTSIGTTLVAVIHAMWLMLKIRPQVILCNGPGTCIPLCVAAFLLKVAGIQWSSIFYVESIARLDPSVAVVAGIFLTSARSTMHSKTATSEFGHRIIASAMNILIDPSAVTAIIRGQFIARWLRNSNHVPMHDVPHGH